MIILVINLFMLQKRKLILRKLQSLSRITLLLQQQICYWTTTALLGLRPLSVGTLSASLVGQLIDQTTASGYFHWPGPATMIFSHFMVLIIRTMTMHLRLPGWFELSHVFINIMYLLSLSRVSWNIELNHHRAHIVQKSSLLSVGTCICHDVCSL